MSKAAVMALFEGAGTPLGNTLNLDVDCVLGLLAALVPIKLWFNQSSHKAAGTSVPSAACVIGLLLSSANACFSMNSRKTVVGNGLPDYYCMISAPTSPEDVRQFGLTTELTARLLSWENVIFADTI